VDFINDFLAINKVIVKKTFKSYIKNLKIIPLFGLYMVAFYLVSALLGFTIGRIGNPGAFVSGILGWLFQSMIFSDFINHVDHIVSGHKTSYKDIGKYYMTHFSQILSATAIPNIIVYLVFRLSAGTIYIPSWIVFLMYTMIATPEIVYQKHVDRLDIFVYGYRFLKENFLNWTLINGIFIMIYLAFMWFVQLPVAMFISQTILTSNEFINLLISIAVFPMITWSLTGLILLFMLVYRGYLFKVLSVSSRRKREYMRNIYGK
jgi:hypothetical protein